MRGSSVRTRLGIALVVFALVAGGASPSARAVPLPEYLPSGLAVNPLTNRLYAVAFHYPQDPAKLFAIDGATSIVLGSLDLENDLHQARTLDLDPVSNRIYILGNAYPQGILGVVDGETLKFVGRKELPFYANHLRLDRVRSLLYATNVFNDTVTVVNAATLEVEDVIPVGRNPVGVDLHEATNRIYIANNEEKSVSVINGETRTVIATLQVGAGPGDVAVNAATNRIYVTNFSGNSVSVIDGSIPRVVAEIPLGRWPNAVAVNNVTNRIYVTTYYVNQMDELISDVTVIDGASNMIIDRIPVGHQAYPVAADNVLNRLYVGNSNLDRNGYFILDPNISVIYGLDLLGNLSFEADADRNGVPDGWSGRHLGAEDRLRSDFGQVYDGKFSLVMTGATGLRKELIQRKSVVGQAGTRLNFEAFSRAKDVSPTGGAYKIRVDILHTDGTEEAFGVPFPRGSHGWRRRARTFTVTKDFDQLTIRLILDNQSGTVWFDSLHLWPGS